jgi:periplasmic protein TonB
MRGEVDTRVYRSGLIDRRELGSSMKLNALRRAAGLPAALLLSLLVHAAVLRFMNVSFEERPNEREAYLVTFEFERTEVGKPPGDRKQPEGGERVLPDARTAPPTPSPSSVPGNPPPREETPTSRGSPLPEERRALEESSPYEPEVLFLDTTEGETAKREGETAALENSSQAKETPDSRTTPASRALTPDESYGERESYNAAVNEELNRRIEKKKVYPQGARRQGVQGTVLCALKVGPSGALLGVEVVETSGSKILDGAAVDLLKRVFPIDNPAGKTLTLVKAIRYSLLE